MGMADNRDFDHPSQFLFHSQESVKGLGPICKFLECSLARQELILPLLVIYLKLRETVCSKGTTVCTEFNQT